MKKDLLNQIYSQLLELEGLVLLLKERNDKLEDIKDAAISKLTDIMSEIESVETCDASDGSDEDDISIVFSTPLEDSDCVDLGICTNDGCVPDDAKLSDSSAIDQTEESIKVLPSKPDLAVTDGSVLSEGLNDDFECALSVNDSIVRCGTDLPSSFTLNDKFRFRRELFGNSETEFTDALNLISAMNSFGEAVEYFFEDLGWDAENEEVKDFIAIIDDYFKYGKNVG